MNGVVDGFFPDGVGVFAVEAEEAEIGLHGVTAAEGLMDEELGAGGEGVFVAAGNLGGDDLAGKGAVSVHRQAG
jgi:hypothetical protein